MISAAAMANDRTPGGRNQDARWHDACNNTI
jgi:hypothetical protein